MDLGELKYTLTLTDTGFSSGLNSADEKMKGAAGTAEKTGTTLEETTAKTKGLGGAFGSMAGQFVIGQAVFTAGQKALEGIKDVISGGIQSAKDWQTQIAGLNQELKSTGDASGMTAEQVKGLAQKTEDKTAIDKAAVLTGQNMLLTFTNIGKDAFPAATQAMVDMSTRMNGGAIPSGQMLSSTAIQLGKALNDPTTGLNALHRVGVTFTDQQKEQITTLQKNGDMMGAQKVILAELGKEFGGAAAANMNTFTGQMAALKDRFEDMIGETLPKIINKLQEFGQWLFDHKPILAAVAGAVAGLAVALGVALAVALWGVVGAAVAAVVALWPIIAIGAAIGAVAYLIYENWNKINKALQPVYEFFDKNIKPVLQEIGRIVKEQLIKAWDDLVKAFDKVIQTLKPFEPQLKIIGIAIGVALVAPIALAVVAIVGLIAAIVAIGVFLARLVGWIAEAIAWFVRFEVAVWTAIIHAVEAVVSTGAKIVQWFIDLPGRILGIVAGAASWLWQVGVNIVQGLVNGLYAIAGAVWNAIKSVADQIGNFFRGAGSWLWGVGRDIIQGLINGIENMAGAVEQKVANVANGIKNVAKKILGIFSPSRVFDEEIGQQITAGLAQGITSGGQMAVNATTNLTQKVVDAGNTSLGGIQSPMVASPNGGPAMGEVNYNFGQGSVILQTAEAVNAFFNIGNRSTQLELMGGSPLAGTAGV